jgi:hypothetical protein
MTLTRGVASSAREFRGREEDAARASARCWASAFVKPRWAAGLGRDSWALQRTLGLRWGNSPSRREQANLATRPKREER